MDNKHFHSKHDKQLKDCPYFHPNNYVDTESQAELYMSIDTGDLPRIQELILRDKVPPIIDQNVLCAFYTATHDMAMPCMQVIFDAIDKLGTWPIRAAFHAHARAHFFCPENLGSTGKHAFQHLTQDAPMTHDEEKVLLRRLFYYGHYSESAVDLLQFNGTFTVVVLLKRLFYYGHYSESAVDLLQFLFERHPCTEDRTRYFLDASASRLRHEHFERYIQMGLDISLLDPQLKEKLQDPFESGLINEVMGNVRVADDIVIRTHSRRAQKLALLIRNWESNRAQNKGQGTSDGNAQTAESHYVSRQSRRLGHA